jgi:hypothetical protein
MSTAILEQIETTVDQQLVSHTPSLNQRVPSYAWIFFDHLYSEYLTLKHSIKEDDLRTLLESINQKRHNEELTWSDIYTFDLTLVDARPPESLVRKAYDARARYRSIAGQKEYDEYLASKPPDLATIRFEPGAPPPDPTVILRADIRYLLSKFYLYYAMLPVRENLRDQLTRRATIVTGIVVVAIAMAIVLNVGISLAVPEKSGYAQYPVVFITVLTVTLAGIIGGCVSMLQRIQSAPSEGDALFNLAALTNGWRGIILSPLYGGIFASLLFVLFAAGILNGAVFPTIHTSKGVVTVSAPSATPTPKNSTTSATTPSSSTVASQVQDSPTQQVPVQIPPTESTVLQIKDFLKETGPADGISYALLIIWSFLAGFAERLVPDTLNRLVAKNEAIQGNNN